MGLIRKLIYIEYRKDCLTIFYQTLECQTEHVVLLKELIILNLWNLIEIFIRKFLFKNGYRKFFGSITKDMVRKWFIILC